MCIDVSNLDGLPSYHSPQGNRNERFSARHRNNSIKSRHSIIFSCSFMPCSREADWEVRLSIVMSVRFSKNPRFNDNSNIYPRAANGSASKTKYVTISYGALLHNLIYSVVSAYASHGAIDACHISVYRLLDQLPAIKREGGSFTWKGGSR
jgi:hypothetical protein